MEFSLIFPHGPGYLSDDCVYVTNLLSDLELTNYISAAKFPLEKYLTKNVDVIRYRQSLFRDLIKTPSLRETFQACIDKLEIIKELRQIRDIRADNETRLYAIKEVETYLDFVNSVYEDLESIREKLESESLLALWKKIEEIYNGEYYQSLKAGTAKLSFSVKNIRSLTIGVNLDATLAPYEAGIISINTEYYHSGDIVSRFMRMEKSDSMTTLAPLTAASASLSGKERQTVMTSLNNALAKIVENNFRSWRQMLKQYFHDQNISFFLSLLPEFKFLLHTTDFIEQMQKYHLPLCTPEVHRIEEKRFSVQKLYNPVIGIKIKESDPEKEIVYNDITFDEDGQLYILTGPNRGGKSVFLNAIGICQLLFQLGLPIPAKSAVLSPVDGIYTHFPDKNGNTYDKGRFGEECARLQEILEKTDSRSLILMDETLSGTDAYEAALIGKEVMTALAIIGARGVFATHLHTLARMKDEINRDDRITARVDTLTVGIEKGERTYLVQRTVPDGNSYARDISNKYGLFVEKILEDNEKYRTEQQTDKTVVEKEI